MKKSYSLCLLALFALLSVALAGCGDDEENTSTTTTSAITLNIKFNAKAYDGQLYYWNQDQQMVVNVSRDPEASGPGTSITRVEYYLDDAGIGSSETSPFALGYALSDVATGRHTLRLRVFWQDNGTARQPVERTYAVQVDAPGTPGPDEPTMRTNIQTNAPDPDQPNVWPQDQTMEVTVTDESTPPMPIKRVAFYFDGQLVGTALEAPFRLRYPLTATSTGQHQLTLRYYRDFNGQELEGVHTIAVFVAEPAS